MSHEVDACIYSQVFIAQAILEISFLQINFEAVNVETQHTS